jgi:flavin-dependent dehydrogenase
VTRLGIDLLHGLDFHLPLPIPHALVENVRLRYGDREVLLCGRPQLLIFHRPELDAYLAQQARQRGARICENETVQTIQLDADRVTVQTDRDRYRARAAIGADGAKGITRRVVAAGGISPFQAKNGGAGRKVRVARLLEIIHPTQENGTRFAERSALFDFTPARQHLQGYFWDFPARVSGQPCSNRGVYDARCAVDRPRARLNQILADNLASLEAAPGGQEIEGHPIHRFSPRNRFALPRLALVGDAAGAEPLFGEGIAPALGYGQVAARLIEAAFARGDFSFSSYRRQLLAAPVGHYLMVRWFVAQISYRLSGHPWFMGLTWSLGGLLAAAWPRPAPLYPRTEQRTDLDRSW